MTKRLSEWTGWKAAVKTICFLLMLALVLGWADKVLALKSYDGLHTMQKFYEQPKNTVDVLVLGSSHAYVDIDPGILWEEYGITAFDLGGGAQPFWNTYYYLKEALKTQTPRLIVMDAYEVTFTAEYQANGPATSNTFGMRWSKDKIEAIQLSAPPELQTSFLLSYSQYHTRSRYLTREDFMENKGDSAKYACWKGSYVSSIVYGFEWPENIQTEERAPMTAKTEEWYRKTIELAQASGIPLLIVVTPYPGVSAGHCAVYNSAADIAAEYGVPFVNFNLDPEMIDPAVDFFDHAHMNIWGSRKFTKYLGEMLTADYVLPDHRGDSAYQSWEDNARYTAAYARDGELARGVTTEEAASLLLNPDYTCAVAVSANGGTAFAPLLEALGIPAGEEGLWLSSGGIVSWASGPENTEYFRLDYHDLKLSRDGGINSIVFDKGAVEQIGNGVTIFVYDSVTQAEAARLTFDAASVGG